MSDRKVNAKTIHKMGIIPASDRPGWYVLEIQVTGELAHYAISENDLRKFSDGLRKHIETADAAKASKAN